jgi:predicted dehydrogenase
VAIITLECSSEGSSFMGHRQKTSRRKFLGQSAALVGGTLATPYFFSSARAQDAAQAPSDRLILGAIGTGDRNRQIMDSYMRFGDVAAVCDVDANHLREAQQIVKERRKEGDSRAVDAYDDYRKILERDDIDVVTIVTPDHWHVKIAIEALAAGKHVYCEKPLTLTIEEGQKVCAAVKKYGKTFQVGTQQRSEFGHNFLKAIAMVRDGRVGKVSKVTCNIGGAPTSGPIPVAEVPKELNWDRWLGQAPMVEYRLLPKTDTGRRSWGYPQSRTHYEFRWWYEYSGGKMTDWGAHHVDIASWALGLDATGPSKIKVVRRQMPVPYEKGWPTQDDRYNTAAMFEVVATFPEFEMVICSNSPDGNGILFEGDKGRFHVSRERIKGRPAEDLKENPLPEDALVKVYKGKPLTSHMANFFDCIKSGDEPVSDVFSHHRAMSTCHLANIALRLDREITWDPEAEKIVGDDEAQTFVSRTPRKGYEIDA